MNKFKRKIRSHMVLEDITTEDLASLLGINRVSLSRKLNGHVPFNDKEKIVIADLFNEDVKTIFFEQ